MSDLVQKIHINERLGKTIFTLEHLNFRSFLQEMREHFSFRKLFGNGRENYELLFRFIEEAGYKEVARENRAVTYQRENTLLGLGDALGIIPIETQTTEATAQQDLENLLKDANALANQEIKRFKAGMLITPLVGALAVVATYYGGNVAIEQATGTSIFEMHPSIPITYTFGLLGLYVAGAWKFADKVSNGVMRLFHLTLPQSTEDRLERYTIGRPVLEKLLGERGYQLHPIKSSKNTPYTLIPAPTG